MKTLKLTAVMASMLLVLTGCSATKSLLAKRDNGSLDYRSSKKLDPIKLPANQPTGEFIPLYQTPAVKGELPDYMNETGKQYKLPKPPSIVN